MQTQPTNPFEKFARDANNPKSIAKKELYFANRRRDIGKYVHPSVSGRERDDEFQKLNRESNIGRPQHDKLITNKKKLRRWQRSLVALTNNLSEH